MVSFLVEAQDAGELAAKLSGFTQVTELHIKEATGRLNHPAGKRLAEVIDINTKENA